MKKVILTFALFSFTLLLSGQSTSDTGDQGVGGNRKLDTNSDTGDQGVGGNRKLDISLYIESGNQGVGGNRKLD